MPAALMESMKKLIDLHEKLHQTAKEKTEAIKDNDMDALNRLLRVEQNHLAAIQLAEKKRQHATVTLANGNGTDTISEIIQILPPQDQERLGLLKQKLIHVLDEVKSANALNQQLLAYSLQLIQLNLDLIEPEQDPGNYSKTEEVSLEQPLMRSAFDSKA